MSHWLRWALAPTDRRVKAAVLAGALPLGVAVGALVIGAGGAWFVGVALGLAAALSVLALAAWLLAPRLGQDIAIGVERVRAAVTPLELVRSHAAPRRVNVVIAALDLEHLFAGYIAVFNLTRRLADSGLHVRVLALEPPRRLPSDWRAQLSRYDGLGEWVERLEIEFPRASGAAVEVSPVDAFLATTTWTAHVAHRASAALGRPRFVQLIQDDEALLFPNGSFSALAREAYRLPHYALFASEPLRDYFRLERLGVFTEGLEAGEQASVFFPNAISAVGPVSEAELAARPRRGLLLYARPEPHAARNMFELAYVALCDAIAAGSFEGDWRFAGVGAVTPQLPAELPGGRRLELLPRLGPEQYVELLRSFSVGVALLDTPHPGLVPSEMAAAGLVAVTSTYANKDAATLAAISPNVIPSAPTLEALTAALAEAARRSGDLAGRARGSHVDLPTSWDEALDDRLIGRVAGWLA